MLNISPHKLHEKVDLKDFKSGRRVFHDRYYKHFNRFLLAFAFIALVILFLPWTQTVSGSGYLTTLKPDHRPQTIQSPIPGRIEQWFVQEGDFVDKGDTILFISEIKNEYFDPRLVERTGKQLQAKSMSVTSYEAKVNALNAQINAVEREGVLKQQQVRNKLIQARLRVESDSIDLEAAETALSIAQRQYDRVTQLQADGLKSLTDVEEKRMKLQESQAKYISQQNKLLASRNELINAGVEINRVQAEIADKVAKAQSDMYTAQSNQFDTEAQVTKLENELSNYQIRNELYYIRAPQSGNINKALQAGIGQTFKEGEQLVNIMPANYQMAVETYIRPLDLPLLHVGEKVRIQFDGWPAIVFSGWPNLSYGTYGGVVVAIETFISDNGKYRVLLSPDPDDQPWPSEMHIGSGATTLALLQDVPIWFEVWRQLNGFPPNYYQKPPKTRTDNKG